MEEVKEHYESQTDITPSIFVQFEQLKDTIPQLQVKHQKLLHKVKVLQFGLSPNPRPVEPSFWRSIWTVARVPQDLQEYGQGESFQPLSTLYILDEAFDCIMKLKVGEQVPPLPLDW